MHLHFSILLFLYLFSFVFLLLYFSNSVFVSLLSLYISPPHQNGLLSMLPSLGMLILSVTGKLFDILRSRGVCRSHMYLLYIHSNLDWYYGLN